MTKFEENTIFVFGSNEAGRHGRGAALTAVNEHGACAGQWYGLQGKSFAIPTKDCSIKTLCLPTIHGYVTSFIHYAGQNPGLTFYVTRIGTGLAGYADEDIAPMFKDAPKNCQFSSQWTAWLPDRDTWTDL